MLHKLYNLPEQLEGGHHHAAHLELLRGVEAERLLQRCSEQLRTAHLHLLQDRQQRMNSLFARTDASGRTWGEWTAIAANLAANCRARILGLRTALARGPRLACCRHALYDTSGIRAADAVCCEV